MLLTYGLTGQRPSGHALRLAALACLISLATTSGLRAQGSIDAFLLQISEKENQLANPDDPMWMKSNMWDISYQRMHERNMPVLELTNLQPESGQDITEFKMSIGDTRFHFTDEILGVFAILGKTTPGYELTSTANGGDLLTVHIAHEDGGGLAPGEILRFRIDLDVDPGLSDPPFFPHPDYRTVLFDINAGGGNEPVEVYGPDPNIPAGQTDNAQASVIFADSSTTLPVTFQDQVLEGTQALYYNGNFRPYGIMEPVDIFGSVVIPEPTSGTLALFALLGGSWLARGSRRRRRSA
jgi:hypothetical protein